MTLIGKTFTRHLDGSTITIKSVDGETAILENNSKINVSSLLDNSQFTEAVNPEALMNRGTGGFYNNLVSDLKGIPDSALDGINVGNQVNMGGSVVESHSANHQFNLENALDHANDPGKAEELRRLAIENQKKLDRDIQKNNNSMAAYLGEEPTPLDPNSPENFDPNLPGGGQGQGQGQGQVIVNNNQQVPTQTTYIAPASADNPIYDMFRGLKRVNDFNLSFDLSDKIPNDDILKMFEEGYDISVLDFLADEFTNKILSDPEKLKNRIRENLELAVYGKVNSKFGVDALIHDFKNGESLTKDKLIEIANHLEVKSRGTKAELIKIIKKELND